MKKAVIATGGNQYLVSEGDIVEIELLKTATKSVIFKPLLLIEDEKITVGKPEIESARVTAQTLEPDIKTEKVTAIRYKAKKRVKKIRGHRQRKSVIKIKKIE